MDNLIEAELKFLQLWNYSVLFDEFGRRGTVLDDDGQVIGTILIEECKDVWEINLSVLSERLKMDHFRVVSKNKLKDSKWEFFFFVLYEGKWVKSTLSWGRKVKIKIDGEDFKIDFNLNDENVEFLLREKTREFNVEENVSLVRNFSNNKEKSAHTYTYSLCFGKKDDRFGIGKRTFFMEASDLHQSEGNIKYLEVLERNRVKHYQTSILKGSIKEVIEKQELGVLSFLRLRFLVNQVWKMKEEVFKEVMMEHGKDRINLEVLLENCFVNVEEGGVLCRR